MSEPNNGLALASTSSSRPPVINLATPANLAPHTPENLPAIVRRELVEANANFNGSRRYAGESSDMGVEKARQKV